ncbi:MAG: sigma-E factor negative regulatory protein [Burkholderiaceae bacterium]
MKRLDGSINRELVSALADGELHGEEFAGVLAAMSTEEAISVWHAYHVVGDVLRCSDLGDCSKDAAFVVRVRSQLAGLPGGRPATEFVMNARLSQTSIAGSGVSVDNHERSKNSANDRLARWKAIAAFASVVAMGALGWSLANFEGAAGTSAQLAQAPTATPTRSDAPTVLATVAAPPVMLRDARLDELLAAHQQFGGISALQMPSGFLRNATFENPQR